QAGVLRADIDVPERALQRARRVYGMRTRAAEEPRHCPAAQLGSVRHLPACPRPVRGSESLTTGHQTIELIVHFLLQQMRRPHLCSSFGQTNLRRAVLRLGGAGDNDLAFPGARDELIERELR